MISSTDVPLKGVDEATALAAVASASRIGQPAFISLVSAEEIAAVARRVDPDATLAGMPFAIKDNIDLAGMPTTAANPARATPAATDAAVVELLIAAGAIPIGKTNLDQYATGLVGTRSPYGACHSVFSAAHISGGSSSGSAVAVATGTVPFALATDTAGSGRVPAAFNELVGFKATRGLISTSGVLPACRSLDCVTVLTRTVSLARRLYELTSVFDPADPYARSGRASASRWLGRRRPVIGVPALDLDLDPHHERAWQDALGRAEAPFALVAFDVRPMLEAAELLYSGPWLAERAAAFGAELRHGAQIDPTVRSIVSAAAQISAEDAFRGMYRLAELRRMVDPLWDQVDAVMLPVTPTHPTLAEVAAQPVTVNSRLGRFTNMTNLLDMAAIAVSAGRRRDGLPFGVQFLGPAFSDDALFGIGALWTGEQGSAEPRDWDAITDPPATSTTRVNLAVAGAHLSGQPLNAELVRLGGRLVAVTRTSPDYRMYELPGPIPRPGLTRLFDSGTERGQSGPGIEVEVWSIPACELAGFAARILPPLALGPLTLGNGEQILGFVCTADGVDPARDITRFGGWRAYLSSARPRHT